MNLATRDIRQVWIEQRGKGAQDAALGLATQSEQYEIMTGKNGIDNLGHNRIVESDNTWENRTALTQFQYQVIAHFVLHAPGTEPLFSKRTMAQFGERSRQTHDVKPPEGNSI